MTKHWGASPFAKRSAKLPRSPERTLKRENQDGGPGWLQPLVISRIRSARQLADLGESMIGKINQERVVAVVTGSERLTRKPGDRAALGLNLRGNAKISNAIGW